MNEYDNLKKAYSRLEKLYTERQVKYIRLKKKTEEVFAKNYDLEELVKAHIRLNKKLNEKIDILERQVYVDLKTAGNRSNLNADKRKTQNQ